MNRYWTLVRLEAKLTLRHKLLHVTVIVALVFGLLLAFAAPAELHHVGHDYVLDASEGQRFAALTEAMDPELLRDDDQAIREAVRDDGSSIGVVFAGRPERPRATVYVQGNESPKRRALIRVGVDTIWQQVGMAEPVEQAKQPPAPTVLDPDATRPPFNGLLLTIVYTLDLCMLGFMFGAVMVLQDKEQGTIRLYRVGPSTALEYVAAKLSVNLGLSVINLVVLTAIAAPWALAKPALIGLALLICAGMTSMGMAIAVFCRNIAQWFFPLIAVSLIGTMPVYLMFTPSPALAWTWWLPTYHLLFGAEAIMFGGQVRVITNAMIYALCFTTLMAVCCWLAVSRRSFRETH